MDGSQRRGNVEDDTRSEDRNASVAAGTHGEAEDEPVTTGIQGEAEDELLGDGFLENNWVEEQEEVYRGIAPDPALAHK
eukprot:15698713-Heterocapsa_arctica.AAC.1